MFKQDTMMKVLIVSNQTAFSGANVVTGTGGAQGTPETSHSATT